MKRHWRDANTELAKIYGLGSGDFVCMGMWPIDCRWKIKRLFHNLAITHNSIDLVSFCFVFNQLYLHAI